MIGVPRDVISMPSPNAEVSRSRTVIGRRAGTVSSSGPSIRFSTRRSASSGSHVYGMVQGGGRGGDADVEGGESDRDHARARKRLSQLRSIADNGGVA
ncbi:hypothetical protein [Planotetraspora sp. GP83]|uniref:hypothetical protein n=1 Tax=Planotetraspora sp. GP83 TaxID=3156264 RepID=UPI003511C6FB